MLITRKSSLTGKTNVMEIDVTQEQLEKWYSGTLIQVAMPNLKPEEREFIKTGYTSDDWKAIFGLDEEEKNFKMINAETHKVIEEFTSADAEEELSVGETYFLAERSNEEQAKIDDYRKFIESAEVGQTLITKHYAYGKVIYQRVS